MPHQKTAPVTPIINNQNTQYLDYKMCFDQPLGSGTNHLLIRDRADGLMTKTQDLVEAKHVDQASVKMRSPPFIYYPFQVNFDSSNFRGITPQFGV